MRNLLLAILLGLSISSSVGCLIPAYSADPVRRAQQLIALREGKLPSDLDPSLRLDACEVLMAQGRIDEAAKAAAEVLRDFAS